MMDKTEMLKQLINDNIDVFKRLASGPKPLIAIPNEICSDIYSIYATFKKAGYDCYLVGGCVRDSLLGRTPKDWDMATNATTEQMYQLFCDKLEIIPTGLEFGTLTLMCEDRGYEVTTYRSDIYNEDHAGHQPNGIKQVSTIEEDLSRRDFTINAMAYDINDNIIIDPHNGQDDLNGKYIRCVGNPITRFTEDPLRMLRAIRFMAQLDGFSLIVSDGIWNCCELINDISAERIQMELNKILLSNPLVLLNSSAINVLCELIPELTLLRTVDQNTPWHIYNAFEHSIRATAVVEPELHLRLVMLFHDLGKYDTLTTDDNGVDHFYNHGIKSCDIARNILKSLKYSNEMIEKVCLLIKEHDRRIELNKKAVKRVLNSMGEEATRDLLKVRWADICAQNPVHLKPRAKKVFDLIDMLEEIIEAKEPFSRKDLLIDGNDLIRIGFKPGPTIGLAFNKLLEFIIEYPDCNDKEALELYAQGLLINIDKLKRISSRY